ncbi:MAG: PIN domain-containing protein [Candidatus Berkelbacteria bacterium]
MKILFDTNIILDVLLEREPFFEIAANLFDAVEAKTVEGYLCATTLTTIDYFLTKYRNREEANSAIKKLLKLYSVAKVDRTVLESALDSNFNDFEDAVIYYSGNDSGVNGIVTRNTGDFKTAQLPIYQPDDLWALIKTSTSFRFQDQ